MKRDLRTALQAAGDEFKAARASMEQTRAHLLPLMVEALKAGELKQREVVELSGYTRESVRNLARLNGIVPK
ncbi:MAG: hypothetical protein JWO67_7404 [Streptosporangiaceae bacterium]|nr:hypothetical protein [Streptosporangiaceae bacterium]